MRARQNSKSTGSKTLNGLARVGEKSRIGKGLFWDICVFGVKKEKSEAFGKINEKGKGLLRLDFQGYLRLQCRKEQLLSILQYLFYFLFFSFACVELIWNLSSRWALSRKPSTGKSLFQVIYGRSCNSVLDVVLFPAKGRVSDEVREFAVHLNQFHEQVRTTQE